MSAEIDDIRKYTTKPQFALNFSEYGQVKAVHFSSYEWSQNILLLSFVKRVLVLNVNIQVNRPLHMFIIILSEFNNYRTSLNMRKYQN